MVALKLLLFSLDSIDVLRMIVMLQKNYGIKVQDLAQGRKILYFINTFAEFIEKNRQAKPNSRILSIVAINEGIN